jgi:hypothetical protein
MPGKRRTLKKQLNKLREEDTRWVERADADQKQSTKDGKTHYMSYSTIGEKGKERYLVYPNVREKMDKFGNRNLKETFKESVDEAIKRRDGLVFDKEKDAEWASSVGYKKYTNFPREVVKKDKEKYKEFMKNKKSEFKKGVKSISLKPKYFGGSGGVNLGEGAGLSNSVDGLKEMESEVAQGISSNAKLNKKPKKSSISANDLSSAITGISSVFGKEDEKTSQIAGLANNALSIASSAGVFKKGLKSAKIGTSDYLKMKCGIKGHKGK